MRQLRASRALSVLYLILFFLSELYSALGTAMDKPSHLVAWERSLGFGLLIMPATLLVGVTLLIAQRVNPGFYLGLASVLVYAAFFIAEGFADRNSPSTATPESLLLIYRFWVIAFVLALAALTALRRSSRARPTIYR